MLAVGLADHVRRRRRGGAARRNLAGVSTAGLDDADTLERLPEQPSRGWFAVVEQAALGFAIATLARSQLAGIGAGIAFYFGETFAAIFLPDIVKYLPFAVAQRRGRHGSDGGGFGGGGAGGELTAPARGSRRSCSSAVWLVGALVVAAVFTERAEITG